MKILKLRNITTFVASVVLVLFTTTAFADVIPSDESQEPVSHKDVELPESSPSSPPLQTDDPGTPGNLGVEVNVYAHVDAISTGSDIAGGVDANLGVGERLQFRIEKEARREALADSENFYGAGSTDVGVKYRFFDDKSLKMALYPSFNFDDGARPAGVTPEGRSIYLPIIISKTLARFTFVLNAGITRYLDLTYRKSNFISAGTGYAISDKLRVMGELTSQLDDGSRSSSFRVGAVKEIFPREADKYETGVFGSVGRSFGPSDDGLNHTTFIFGFSIARKPD